MHGVHPSQFCDSQDTSWASFSSVQFNPDATRDRAGLQVESLPPLQTPITSLRLLELLTLATDQGSPYSLLGFDNLLERLTELRKPLCLLSLVYYKGTTQEQLNGRDI